MARNYVIHPIPLVKLLEYSKLKMVYPIYAGLKVDYGQIIPMVIYMWYLEGGGQNIIVDAAVTAEKFAARGHKVEQLQTLDEGLNKLGLKPGDIDVLILTHLHFDHITLAQEFPKAKVVVQQAELEFARNPHPFNVESLRQPADSMKVLEGLDYQVVSGDTQIDDGIEVLLTPGHSPGGQSVAVRTAEGTAIIAGFCCIQENFNPPPELQEKGVSFMLPGMHLNALEIYDSMARIKKLADLIIPLHEADLVSRLTIP